MALCQDRKEAAEGGMPMGERSSASGRSAVVRQGFDDDDDSLERVVRAQVMAGGEHVRKMEETMRLAAAGRGGCLSFSDCSRHGRAVREDLMGSATAIVSTFSKLITFLSSTALQRMISPITTPADDDAVNMGEMRVEGDHEEAISCENIGSPISTARTEAAHYFSTPSPDPHPHLGSDQDQTEKTRHNSPQNQTSAMKKRKLIPTRTFKLSVESSKAGWGMPPPDGFTWCKYGQKFILGSRCPRGYYRCSRKRELGCPAIKYVQISDEDPPFFNIILKGQHTCTSATKNIPSSLRYMHPSFHSPPAATPTLPRVADAHTPTKPTTGTDLSVAFPDLVAPKFGFDSWPLESFQAIDEVAAQAESSGFSLVVNSGGDPIVRCVSSIYRCRGNSFQAVENNMKAHGWMELNGGCKADQASEPPNSIPHPNSIKDQFLLPDDNDFVSHLHPKGSDFKSIDGKQSKVLTSRSETPLMLPNSLPSNRLYYPCLPLNYSYQDVAAEQSLHTLGTNPMEMETEDSPATTLSMYFMMGCPEAPRDTTCNGSFEPFSCSGPSQLH